MRKKTAVLVFLATGLLGLAESGRASISIAKNVVRPALRVDARGNAEVSWSSGGVRRTLLVPAAGLYLPGGRITTTDISRPTTIPGLPFAKVTRRAPDGTLYALQTWRVEPDGPVELHFSRWKGGITTVALSAEPASGSERLVGRAQFQGKPVGATRARTRESDTASLRSSTAFAAPSRPGVASAESRRALTERFGYSSSPSSKARGTESPSPARTEVQRWRLTQVRSRVRRWAKSRKSRNCAGRRRRTRKLALQVESCSPGLLRLARRSASGDCGLSAGSWPQGQLRHLSSSAPIKCQSQLDAHVRCSGVPERID